MKFVHLGRTGLLVSRLCLGSLGFGPETPQSEALNLMDRAHEQGINFFDTSNVYGKKHGGDWSEEVIGRWFAGGGGRRERTVIATKVYEPQSDWPNDSKLSALHIRRACEASLRRLQTDCIDLYQMHHIDRDTPFDEIWEAMDTLRTQGKIIYVGSSNFAGWHIAQAQGIANARHSLGLVSEQSLYNLVTRDVEREVIPAAQAFGLALNAWSPLGRGLLGGVLARDRAGEFEGRVNNSDLAPTRVTPDMMNRYRAQLERYEKLSSDLGVSPAQVALAWLFTRPALTTAVIGPISIAQLDDAVGSIDVVLDDDVLAELDSIFPGYKSAPEDYAW